MKRWTQLLVYASLAFVLLWLTRQDMLAVPHLRNWPALVGAILLLGVGFAGSAASWRRLLRLHGLAASPAQSLASVGLTVFGKYIPGKLWVVMGSAHLHFFAYPWQLAFTMRPRCKFRCDRMGAALYYVENLDAVN